MSKDTVHNGSTVHGYSTPHKYPQELGTQLDVLNDLSVQLYPTGRAWYKPENGIFENFHKAINISFARFIKDSKSLINGTFPDNEDFTENDAKLWEYRLGLITNESLDLDLRRINIKRKLGHPNNIQARQHPNFIQDQLNLAGFNVFVHENTLPYQTPQDLASLVLSEIQHGGDTQHGSNTQHGGDSFSVIANSIDEIESFAVGTENLWATFFIGGQIKGSTANIPQSRLREFKELVIKLKPAHTVAFTFINYI